MEEGFQVKESWEENKKKYNIGLVIAGFLGFISYCIVGGKLIPPAEFEVTIFSIIFQGIGYLVMMKLANLIYTLFMDIDQALNRTNNLCHKIIFYGYFIISFFLPFSISILLYIFYHDGYPGQ